LKIINHLPKMKLALFLPALLLTVSVYAQTDTANKIAAPIAKENFSDDWANLRHYEAENKLLPAPVTGRKSRGVFRKFHLRVLENAPAGVFFRA
jgi:hypothetical protein